MKCHILLGNVADARSLLQSFVDEQEYAVAYQECQQQVRFYRRDVALAQDSHAFSCSHRSKQSCRQVSKIEQYAHEARQALLEHKWDEAHRWTDKLRTVAPNSNNYEELRVQVRQANRFGRQIGSAGK